MTCTSTLRILNAFNDDFFFFIFFIVDLFIYKAQLFAEIPSFAAVVIEDEESDWEDRVNGGKTEDRDGIMISRKPMLLIKRLK